MAIRVPAVHHAKAMAHQVRATLDTKVVKSKDLKVVIKKDGAKLGTLLISQGNLEWLPSGNSVNKRRMKWAKFAEMMEEKGTLVKVPRES